MLQYKLKRFYNTFGDLKKDILKIFVLVNDNIEKLIIQHHTDKLEIVR